jgi:hypothetical protein
MVRTMLAGMAVMLMTGPAAPGGQSGDTDQDPEQQRLGPVAEIPQFGGAWVEEIGGERVLNLWLTDPDERIADRAVDALLEHDADQFANDRVQIHRAEYRHDELTEWARVAGGLPQVTMTWVDQRANQLVVGVADLDADAEAVEAELATAQIPTGAVSFDQVGPIAQAPLLPADDDAPPAGGPPGLLLAIAGLVTAGALATVAALASRRWRQRST